LTNKIDFFNLENKLRHNAILKEDFILNEINLGYILDDKNNLILENMFVKYMLLRYNGLKNCICNQEFYIENNKNDHKELKFLEFFKNELKKLESLVDEYEKNKYNIEYDKKKKIEFVKKICKTINWGFENDNSKCENFKEKKDFHPKTFNNNKQLVLGDNSSEYINYLSCNNFFLGLKISHEDHKASYESCDKTVEWNILLNKYSTLATYYKESPFIRFIINNGLITPYRRYPPVTNIKGYKIGEINFSLFKFNIYLDKMKDLDIGRYTFNNLKFFDEKNFKIIPPLLRSSITITYTEFRDLLCYLNLPVFRSTRNKSMLFFPNYDLHQRLLEIQGLPRNYSDYTDRSIDWKWFKKDEKAAKEAIACFCQEYEESPGYSIEPVEYVWYEIKFETGNTKKYIFLVCTFQEWKDYYSKTEYLVKKDNPLSLYAYNDEIRDHALEKLEKQFGLVKPKSKFKFWREKYLKYKRKYLELKSKYLELKKLE
jgi:hypothetical protein